MKDKSGSTELAIALAGAVVGFWCGIMLCTYLERSEAIQHHAAEYRCDPETGKTTFVWLTDETEAEKETPCDL